MSLMLKVMAIFIITVELVADVIYIEGSSTILPVMKQSKKEYFDKHGITLSIKGGGSSKGIDCLLGNRCQIGMISRALNKEEKEKGIKPHLIGYDGIAIIVNKNNPINDISTKKIQDVYSGRLTKWSDITGENSYIFVLAKQDGRATRLLFDNYFNIQKLNTNIETVGSNIEDIITVSLDKDAISYVSIGSAQEAINNGADIKMISLDGIPPTINDKTNPSYPLSRLLNLATTDKPSKSIQDVISLMRSDIGQHFVSEHSFIQIDKSSHVK